MKRILKALAWTFVLAAGAFALYLVTANILIGTRLLRTLINDGPDAPSVEYTSAWSLWPGRVRIHGFHLRDRGFASEWSLALDEGRGSIRLLELLRGKFHPSHIRGTGLVIRVRKRLSPAEATPHRLAFLPPISGFPDPPLREAGQTPPLPTGREWTIRLDDVVVDAVREIWVDDYRYTGDATLVGGLLLHPRRRLEFFPTSLDVRDGRLHLRDETLAGALIARLDVVVHPYDLRGAPGSAVLRFMTGTGRITGKIDSVRSLNELLHTPPSLRLEEGTGTLSAELALDNGHGNGSLDFSVAGAQAVMPAALMKGNAQGQLLLAALDLDAGRADFAGSRVELTDVLIKRGNEAPWLWQASLNLPAGELRTDLPRVFYTHVELRALNARPLYRLLDLKLPAWAERLLELEQLEAKAVVAIGKSFVDMKSLDATGGAFRILGRYHFAKASKDVGEGVFLIDAGPLALGIGVGGGEKKLRLIGARSWYRKQTAENGKE